MTDWILGILSAITIPFLLWLIKKVYDLFKLRCDDHKLMRKLPEIFAAHKKEHEDIKTMLVTIQEVNQIQQKAHLCTLRQGIVNAHKNLIEKGCMTIQDHESITKSYEQYVVMGGNGTIHKLMEDLDNLSIIHNN